MQFIHQAEQIQVIDFTNIRLVPLGYACDLHATKVCDIAPHFHREIALHDLTMVKIELHFQIRLADFAVNRVCIISLPIEKNLHVARIDRFNQSKSRNSTSLHIIARLAASFGMALQDHL